MNSVITSFWLQAEFPGLGSVQSARTLSFLYLLQQEVAEEKEEQSHLRPVLLSQGSSPRVFDYTTK